MPDAGMRARVSRMLGGDFRLDDLSRLFLYARDRCDGREAVQEIGDFVAHHDERTKGVVTREVRDWFAIVKFHIPNLGRVLDGNRLPIDFPEFLRASYRRVSKRHLRDRAGLRHADAKKVLEAAIDHLVRNPDGTWSFSDRHTQKESNLIRALISVLVSRPAFDSDRLFTEFSSTLKSHALLERRELSAFEDLKPAIGLFAVSLMHNSRIVLGDGSICRLEGFVESSGVHVNSTVPVPRPDGSEVQISSSIFSTSLIPSDHCEASLLSEAQPWAFNLEVNSDRKLVRLG